MLGPGSGLAPSPPTRGARRRCSSSPRAPGFQHSVIARKGDKLSLAERILTELGKEHGFEVVASKDGRLFDPDKIGQWDAFAFETTGDLTSPAPTRRPPMSADGKKAFLDAIRGGKGFVGMHCATDTFHSQGEQARPLHRDDRRRVHHPRRPAESPRSTSSTPTFPAPGRSATSFEINDEWYALKNLADDLHVIIVHDTPRA